MIDDLDARLVRIASLTMPGEIDGLDQAVLGRIATERAQAGSVRRIGVAAVTGALLLGGFGSLDRGSPAHAAGPFAVIGGADALDPSTLLGGS